MRIFLAGAGGAVGRPLTAMLVAAGHEVTGTTRSTERAASLAVAGASPVVLDVLDADAVLEAVAAARPDVVLHQVTDLAGPTGAKLDDDQLGANARVREIGGRNLVEAAAAAGARRVVAQSLAWLYVGGSEPHREDDPIIPSDGVEMSVSRRAVIELERLILADGRFEGVVLRYGRFYGTGTWTPTPPEPPTVHVVAAAHAAVLAIDHGEPGAYNVVDDGGPVSNAKARDALGWRPDVR